MKRPKIADMTALERGRFRLLQAYRGARRNLDDLKYIDEAELPPDEIGKLHKFRREMQTIVMAIPPRNTQNAFRSVSEGIGFQEPPANPGRFSVLRTAHRAGCFAV